MAYLAEVCGTFEEYSGIRGVELDHVPGMARLELPFDPCSCRVFYNPDKQRIRYTDRAAGSR